MKTATRERADAAAPIVQLAASGQPTTLEATPERARAFAEPLLTGRTLDSGEDTLAHADGVAAILQAIGAAPAMRAAAWLVYASDHLAKPEEAVRNAFGESFASLVGSTRKLVALQRAARDARVADQARAQQTERVRKMLLAFSRDLRVVLLRLASRLQTLRWYATAKQPCPEALAAESLQVFAPLANRLGIWPIKWELEDLAFRFLEPEPYREIARHLDARRIERERQVERSRRQLQALLREHGIGADVSGRPKHLYSIWKKMQGKSLDFARVFDVRALRVVVTDVQACYAVLGLVHERWPAVAGEFDDYIARPKANGYQSLHTVVRGDDGLPVEIQIRTHEMHRHAEAGVAAHWAYKEAGVRGSAGLHGAAAEQQRIAEARKAVLRQLLAWERDFVEQDVETRAFDDRIYVFTPAAQIVELSAGATPIDFAYALHTDLGHRCRGAKVDGRVVPLNTPLASGQTVEVVAAKEGGPSLDWLNAELGYLASARSKAKVRAWFNALAQAQTVARGREAVEKLLQREGRTALKLDDLAAQLGFRDADALFEVVGKDEYSLRNIEALLKPAPPPPVDDPAALLRRSRADEGGGGVLVVGMESLLTQLARCCKPAPPDTIAGFVTRGRGVAIHRADCRGFRELRQRSPERVIAVAWGRPRTDKAALYPVDVLVEAADRPGLLRDLCELFAKEKMNVTGVKTQSVRDAGGDPTAWMSFTLEVADASRLRGVLAQAERVVGVRKARRR